MLVLSTDHYYMQSLLSNISQLAATLLKKIDNEGNPPNCYSARKPFDEKLYHAEPTYSFAQSGQPSRICGRFSNEIKGNGIEESFQEDSSDELFHGFLAIGTLGLESLNTEPPTPTFPKPFENMTDKEVKITEDELKLINNELAKFLEAEAKEVADESSARSSQASIITFSNKQHDETDAEDLADSTTCPLQTYLFGSSIELPEMAAVPKKEKTSLEELFRRTDTSCEKSTNKYDCTDYQPKKRHASHFMKKILKKLQSTASSCTTASAEKATESEAIKRKLPKVMKIFHRKVHPEGFTTKKQFIQADEDKSKKNSSKSNNHYAEDTGKKRSHNKSDLKKEISKSVLSFKRADSGRVMVNREHWIKTDADYLVLEL
ncbi:protein LAZY 1-like [Coffea arabica]|uniref:Protein LAZY 1-like n=1 Tax=Coffea arabica TaxID=13443 RepID=A0ABM4V6R2_COFAR